MAWRVLRAVDKKALADARLQAHHALQWLARAARAYVSEQPDDLHTSLLWDDALGGFLTRALPGGARLGLELAQLRLVWRNARGAEAASLALDRRRNAEVSVWLGELLAAQGLDADLLAAPAPYEIEDHPVAHGAAYDVAGSADPLRALAAWFGNAAAVLERVRAEMLTQGLAAADLLGWPHHFDLATLAPLPGPEAGADEGGADASPDGAIGVGLSPGDEYYAEPYFYVTIDPEPDPAALPALPAPGHWHTNEFVAAIAPASAILDAPDQEAATERFLRAAVGAARTLIE